MAVIGEFRKNAMEKIIATLGYYKGHFRLDIRVYFQPTLSQPDIWVPTKKGVNLPLDNWRDFKKLVHKIDQALKGKG